MKRLIRGILTVSFLFALGNINVNALTTYGYVKNILDLKNVYISDSPEDSDGNKCFKSINPIVLEKDSTYTFVIFKDYFNHPGWGHPNLNYEAYLRFKDNETSEILGRTYSYDYESEYAYLTFKAITENMIIHELPIETPSLNHKFMLFKGDISLFNGEFSNYKSKMNTLNWAYINNYDDQLTLNQIITYVDIDNTQGSEVFILEDLYTPNIDKLGEHEVVLMIVNNDYNRMFCKLLINTVDITPPVIVGKNYYELELGEEVLSVSDIIRNLRVNDNFSSLSEQDIVIIKDSFTRNKDKLGNYFITLEIADSSNNIGRLEVEVKVQDTKPPIIEGPSEIYRYTTDTIINELEIKELFSVYDGVDGNLIDHLEIEGTSKNEPGTYVYTLKVKDTSNNLTTKTLKINVVEGKIPSFNRDVNYVLTYKDYMNMSEEDIKNWLLERIEGVSEVNILLNEAEYIENKSKPMYLYYSYTYNNQQHYGRLLIKGTKENNVKAIIIASALAIINIGFGFAYYKRPNIQF